jgi:hypothetical protein
MTRALPSGTGETSIPGRFLCTVQIDFHPAPTVHTATGTRMVYAARRGTFTGPGLSAELVPGSADWLVVGTDLIARVDVRAALVTDDGATIYMTSTGRVHLREHATRFFAGELVTAEEAYIRTAPLFETTAERYAHLSGVVCVAYCDLSPTEIRYRIHTLD